MLLSLRRRLPFLSLWSNLPPLLLFLIMGFLYPLLPHPVSLSAEVWIITFLHCRTRRVHLLHHRLQVNILLDSISFWILCFTCLSSGVSAAESPILHTGLWPILKKFQRAQGLSTKLLWGIFLACLWSTLSRLLSVPICLYMANPVFTALQIM